MSLSDKFTSIANAIRNKTGSAEKLTLDQMPDAIKNIMAGHPNGTKWMQSNVTSGIYLSIEYHNGLWVAGGYEGNLGIKYSTDGKIWTSVNDLSVYNIQYANDIWVASTKDGIYYSENGKMWTQSNVTASDIRFMAPKVMYAGNLWVVITNKSTSWYSTDGKTWTVRTYSGEGELTYNDMYANGIWITDGRNGDGIFYSEDGVNYTRSNITSNEFRDPVYANGVWVIASMLNSKGIYYSTDGKEWIPSNVTSGEYLTPCYGDGLWVAVSEESYSRIAYTSVDGIVWTQISIPSDSPRSVQYVNGMWFLNDTSKLHYSFDGKVWLETNLSSFVQGDIVTMHGVWLADVYQKSMWYSFDGITWYQSNLNFNKSMYTTPKNVNGIWVLSNGISSTIKTGLWYSVTWEP